MAAERAGVRSGGVVEWWSGGVVANRIRMRGSWNCNYLEEFLASVSRSIQSSCPSSSVGIETVFQDGRGSMDKAAGESPTPTRPYAETSACADTFCLRRQVLPKFP